MPTRNYRASARPGLTWSAMGAIGAVILGGTFHLPASPVWAADPTPITVGEAPCVQRVSDDAGITVDILTETDEYGEEVPTDCVITFTRDAVWEIPATVAEVWALVVGGGGSGSEFAGGGAGDVYENTELSVFDPEAPENLTLDIRVGRGGANDAGGSSVVGNVRVAGGQPGDDSGRGGASGSGEPGGEPSTADDGVSAGGGGAGARSGGTHAAITLGEALIAPAVEGSEDITPEPEEPSSDEADDVGPAPDDQESEDTADDDTSDTDREGEVGSEEEEGVEEEGAEEEVIEEEGVVSESLSRSFLRAGSGGNGASSDITGETTIFAGGGAGAFSLGESAREFDAASGRNGDGGGSGSWGGGGAAGQSGGDGVVVIRYAITEKNIQVITWDVPEELELDQTGFVLPAPETSGDGVVSFTVVEGSASSCVVDTVETEIEGETLRVTSLTFSTLGDCLLSATAEETASYQAATLTKTILVVANRPVVQSATPDRGPLAGGTRVSLTGRNFTGATEVTFEGLAGSDLRIISDTLLEVTTPLRTGVNFTPGFASIRVSSLGRASQDDIAFLFHNSQYMLDNGRLRFGGGGGNGTTVNSIDGAGNLLQPFYRSGTDWFRLTFSSFPLDLAIGTGTGGSNWSGSTVAENPTLSGQIVSSPDFVETSTSGGIRRGYGTVISRGTASVNSNNIVVQSTYELGENRSFIKITTRLENPGATPIANVNLWVGTRDDFVGTTDGPSKTRGNLVNGVFTPIVNSPDPSSALLIESGAEGVLFYSTTENTGTSIAGCCQFRNAYGQSPAASPVRFAGHPEAYHDGSYALHLPVGTLAGNGSREIIWFYAAGSIAELAQVAQDVASAANPPKPGVERGDGSATISWTEPNPGTGNEITSYQYRYSTNGGVTWIDPVDVGIPNPLEATVTGLNNNVNYIFEVRAMVRPIGDPDAAIQEGAWSPGTDPSVLGVPNAPVITTAVGGDGTISVVFDEPTSPVDAPISYEYRVGPNDDDWASLPATGTPLTATISGLANGQEYPLQIRARNLHGPSQASPSRNVVTAPVFTTTELPSAPALGTSFGLNLVASVGISSWSVPANTLPQGLGLNTSTGRIQGTPTQSGPYDFTITATNAAGSVSQRFVGVVIPHWPDNTLQFAGAASASLQQTISTADIIGLSLGSGATVTVTGLPDGVVANITNESVANTTPGIVLAGTPTTPGVYEVVISIRDSNNRVTTQTVTLIVTNPPPATAPAATPRPPQPRPQPAAIQMEPPAPAPLEVRPTPQQNTFVPIPPSVRGPILQNGQAPTPQAGNINIRRDDNSLPAQARILGNTGLDIQTGSVTLGVRIQAGTGEVRSLADGSPEITVERGSEARIQGSGFLPNSTAQVFLPLQGNNAIELARVQVDSSGGLSGDARFLTGPGQAPIPVGPQVLQIVSIDADGRRMVVEMTVSVAQPPPAPELNRDTGEIPTLTPGQSFATVAGLEVEVRVDIDPDNGSTRVDGGDWSMEIGVSGERPPTVPGPDGSLMVELERDSLAVVSGSGFMPQTRVDVWLFSTPVLLGTVVTDDDGSFDGFVSVDSRTVPTGAHTLQLQGVGTDGYVRSANLGVIVSDVLGDATTPTVFPWWWWALAGGVLGLVIWFVFIRRADDDDQGDLEDYDPSRRVYPWSVTENSPNRGSYRADLIGVSRVRHT